MTKKNVTFETTDGQTKNCYKGTASERSVEKKQKKKNKKKKKTKKTNTKNYQALRKHTFIILTPLNSTFI